jgi:hypothetical protein
MAEREAITVDEVRRRAALAGVTIDEEFIGEVALAMEVALEPLRALDPEVLKPIEPAVRFAVDTAGDEQPSGPS